MKDILDINAVTDFEEVEVRNFWECPANEQEEHEGYTHYRVAILGDYHREKPEFRQLVPKLRNERLGAWKTRLKVGSQIFSCRHLLITRPTSHIYLCS